MRSFVARRLPWVHFALDALTSSLHFGVVKIDALAGVTFAIEATCFIHSLQVRTILGALFLALCGLSLELSRGSIVFARSCACAGKRIPKLKRMVGCLAWTTSR